MISWMHAALLLLTVALVTSTRGQDAAPAQADGFKTLREESLARQKRLKEEFRKWHGSMVGLKQRLEGDPKTPDREAKAGVLKKALEKAHTAGVEGKLDRLVIALTADKDLGPEHLKKLVEQHGELAGILRQIVVILMTDSRDAALQQQNEAFKGRIQKLSEAIGRQERLHGRTGKSGAKATAAELLQEQKQMTATLRDVAQGLDKDMRPEDKSPHRKPIEDALTDLERAQGSLEKDNRAAAATAQDAALGHLNKAAEVLQGLLNRRREEERDYRLDGLSARFQRMRQMQTQVQKDLIELDAAIRKNADQKPGRPDVQRSLGLSEQQEKVIREAEKVIVLLDIDGSAVAFPEVLRMIRDDMASVRRRLTKVDTGKVTQAIGKDVVETLEEMVNALKPRHRVEVAQPPKPPAPEEPFAELVEQLLKIAGAELSLHLSFKTLYEHATRPEPRPIPKPDR